MTRLIELGALSARDQDAWRELARRALVPNPFFELEAVLAAHGRLAGPPAAVIVAEDAAGWTGCLPVVRVARGAALRSWAHLYTFLGMPLVSGQPALVELLRGAVRASPLRLVVLDALPDDGPGGRLLHDATAELGLAPVLARRHVRATLARRAEPSYLEHLGRHHQRERRRLGRRLDEALGGPAEVADRSSEPAAVEAFLRLEASGWKGRGGTAMLSRPADADFFRTLTAAFRADDRLQLLSLEAGGRPVAMKCNLAAGPGLFCFKIAQDDAYNRFSPGVQLEQENVERFHRARGERWMDSCAAPDNAMINRLWPERRAIRTAVLGPRDLRRGLLAVGARRVLAARDNDEPGSTT